MITPEHALEFLRRHQPMPADLQITDEEAETFSSILNLFQAHPDPRCLPLLIHAVSANTGMGMYEQITDVLQAHDVRDVVPHLRNGLVAGSDGVKYRCCWWAADVEAWELEDEVRPLAEHADDDVREAAEAFLELKAERA